MRKYYARIILTTFDVQLRLRMDYGSFSEYAKQCMVLLHNKGHSLHANLPWQCLLSGHSRSEQGEVGRSGQARANVGCNFVDVVFSDKCSIQMESHCSQKRDNRPKNVPPEDLVQEYHSLLHV